MSVLLIICIALYFTPGLIAAFRSHHQAAAIIVLNLLLGWTIIGWVVAIVWACMNPPPVVVASREG
jgi:hypothetical protein